jgi:hypothetical protein
VQLIAAQIRGMGEIGHARRLRFRCVWQVPARRSVRRVGALTP